MKTLLKRVKIRQKLNSILLLCFILLSSQLFAQNASITGAVKDADGEPLIGVSIAIKGTTKGTISNADGSYTLSASPSDMLVFSYVGYKNQEIAVKSQTTINVVLLEDETILDEVVITALGMKRDSRALGYAISSVRGDDLIKAGAPINPLATLYGKAAGVGLQATSGGPMGGMQIKIRGSQGLDSSSSTRPLFVVDGVPIYDQDSDMGARGYDPLNSFDYGSAVNDINAEDIESMEILKGAKASVLYGSKGANGVVLITTRTGAGTRGLGVSINYGHEWEIPYTYIDFQNEFGTGVSEFSMSYEDDENKTGRRIVSGRQNFGPRFDGSPIKFFDGTTRPYQAYKNNYMDLFKNGSNRTFNASVSGGNEKGHMRLSFSNNDYEGTMQNQGQIKNSLSFNGMMKVSDFASFEFLQNLYQTKANNRRPNLQQMIAYGAFNRDYDLKTAINSYKDEDGYMHKLEDLGNIEEGGWGWPAAFTSEHGGFFQMLWNNNENRNTDKRMHSITSAKANFKFFPFLTLRLTAGIDYTETEYIKKNKVEQFNEETGKYTGGKYGYSREKNKIQNYEAFLMFDKEFTDKDIRVTAFAGPSVEKNDYTSIGVATMGNFKFPDFWSITNGTDWPAQYEEQVANHSTQSESMYSVLGQATIDWRRAYVLEFSARNDWTSTLPKQNRSYFYPGASFIWNFTEDFKLPNINYGKFRISWADVGRKAPRYFALRSYSMNTLPAPNTHINDVTGPGTLFSGDIKPERKREFETGFNLRMFKNRLEVDFAYYNNTVYDQIMSIPVPASSGAQLIRINAGKTRNQGLELFVKGSPVQTQNFGLELSFTAAHQWDEIISLYPGISQINNTVSGIDNRAAEGRPMGELWMFDYLKDDKGNRIVGANGLYSITKDAKQKTNVGSINPDIYGGLTTNLFFRGNWGVANLTLGIDYRFGGKVLSYSNFYLKGNGLAKETLAYRDAANGGLEWTDSQGRIRHDGLILPGVKVDGTTNDKIVSASDYYSTFIHDMSEGWQPDALQTNNYIKFRELALMYTVPKRISNIFKLEKLSVSFTARNLFYFYKSIDHIDAEAMLGTGINSSWVENSNYPASRTFGFKLNISF